jgi:aminopeptidase N
MNKTLASILSLSLLAVSCNFPSATATPPPIATLAPTPDPLETPWDDRAIFKDGLVPSAQSVLDELDGASVYHLEFKIAEDLYHVTGTEEVRYTNTEEAPLNEVQFRLFPNILGGEMLITNLLVDGESITPSYALEDSLMMLQLPRPLAPDQGVVISMDFSVTVPTTVEQNYGVLAYAEDVLALAHAYPMIAVYDDEGWNAEIPPQDGDVTFADASFYIVRVTAPKGLTLVTSGHRVGFDEAGQVQALTVASGPARDFYLAASPLYEERFQTFGDVTIRSYAPKDSEAGSQTALDVASRAIKIFGERYAPYPYTELDIVSTPTLALGIEYPGMIAITSWIYDVNDERADVYMESTVAHEVGHQWFYNLVGDDQLDDPWLDEALTQFATLQYYIDEYGVAGEEGFTNDLKFRWSQTGSAMIPIGLPVAGYDDGSYGAIVYGRGPLFFVALKEEMGAEAFDAFLKEYTRSLSWKISTPQTLQSLAEKNCACDLDAIFNEWVYP